MRSEKTYFSYDFVIKTKSLATSKLTRRMEADKRGERTILVHTFHS